MSSGSEIKLLHSDDDAACGKFWEIYANEAKEYDGRLVKGWKEDMDVILVFAALYSAILTAFVIESYKSLQEDPADVSAQLLKTISQQLASPSSIPNATQASEVPFTPTPSALACNILWFISLSLSLICAFLAMFIQQWSRHFMHRITMGRSPTVRARLIQFFYFGLKEHRMHIIVDVIPYLLHVSLFLFFGGLSAFLWSTNRPLAWLMSAVLASLVVFYIMITMLPIISLSSPYQTPLSSLCWRILQPVLKHFSIHGSASPAGRSDIEKGHGHASESGHDSDGSRNTASNGEWSEESPVDKPTLLQAMIHRGRTRHESQESESIAWTLRSLNDENDFLKFIEVLPGLLEDHRGFRYDNIHLLKPILETTSPHCNVIARAHWLLLSADNLWHTNDHRERCRPGVLKFFWVFCRLLLDPLAPQRPESFSGLKFPKEVVLSLRTKPYERDLSLSVMVLCMLQNYQSLTGEKSAVLHLVEMGNEIFKDYSYHDKHGLLTAGWHLQPEERLTLTDVISHIFYAYLQVAGIHFPSGFDDVCRIFHHHGIQPTNPCSGPSSDSGLLATLTFQLYLSDDPALQTFTPSLNDFDSIFKVILKSSRLEDQRGVASYISRRVELGWWTSTTWQNEELKQLCNVLIKPLSLLTPAPVTATWADACKWIIAYGHNHSIVNPSPIRSMLESMIQSTSIENYPSLAFFVKLTIIKMYNYHKDDVHKLVLKKLGYDGRFKDFILDTDPQYLDPYIDSRFKSRITPKKAEICSGERGINGLLLLIEALTARLPLSECREILEFFHYLGFPDDSVTFLARQPRLLHELVKITEEFCTLWISNPSADLFDIIRMLWRMWRSITLDGPWKDPNPWRDLKPEANPKLRADWIDPGPWGDPDPWGGPDLSCITTLRPLLDSAKSILSAPKEFISRINEDKMLKRQRIRLYIGIDGFDLVLDVTNVKESVVTLSSDKLNKAAEVSKEQC